MSDATPPKPTDLPSPANPSSPAGMVRRRFLLAGGAYVAPAVLAAVALGDEAYGACPPYVTNCSPFRSCAPGRCTPATNPCAPTGGG